MQSGCCFICEQPIHIKLQGDSLDIDHVEPLKVGGKDAAENFAMTHASCNRSKQASDLRVARVLARFERIRRSCAEEGRGPNLADVLGEYGGAKHELAFETLESEIRLTFEATGDPRITALPLFTDPLSKLRYFFAELPIEYLHHDDRINPRSIGGSLAGLVEEFHRGRPQLHAGLAWLDRSQGPARVKVFDGQHKATAQVLLGVRALPIRVFVDPDPDLLLTTNTNAGTTLRQVAFDKSVQRRLGKSLFNDRLERYRKEKGLPDDDESMSEKDLVTFFKGGSRADEALRAGLSPGSYHASSRQRAGGLRRVRGEVHWKTAILQHHRKNLLVIFHYPDVLDTPLNYKAEQGLNPRQLEIDQVVRLMNLTAEVLLANQFDMELGTARLENKVQKGEDIPEPHLRAFRMCKEEVLYSWLTYLRQVVQMHFMMSGQPFDQNRSFQYNFPEQLWDRLRAYLINLRTLPLWVNRNLSATVFGGKQNSDFWRTIFLDGKTPQGQQVLTAPLNIMEMIKDPTGS